MAYQVTVFETAKELFDAFADGTIPRELYLVHEDGGPTLSGTAEARKYDLESLSWDDIFTEALNRAGMDIHFT